MLQLNPEQKRAYDHYIKMRDKMKMVLTSKNFKNENIPKSEVLTTVDVIGSNHGLFIRNDDWFEYMDAFQEWLRVEPEFRKTERMSSIRGDYGVADDWEDPEENGYPELK